MTTRYSRSKQEQLIRSTFPRAAHRAAALLQRESQEIMELGIQRMLGTGFEIYGDSSFHLPIKGVYVMAKEEAADLYIYEAIYDLKENGVIK